MVYVEIDVVLFTVLIFGHCTADSENLFNITRILNGGDVFWYDTNTDNCDSDSCSIYSASTLKSSPCHCQCPSSDPVFFQHIKQCSSYLEINCPQIDFINSLGVHSTMFIPTTFLPMPGEVLNPNLIPYWDRLDFRNASDELLLCNVSEMAYLTINGWIQRPILFSLINKNGYTYLQWLGTMFDQIELTGKVVYVSIQCDGKIKACLAFRIIGKDIMPFGSVARHLSREKSKNQTDKFGLIIGVICGVFLTATLLGVGIFWFFCWRQQKRRHISRHVDNAFVFEEERYCDQVSTISELYSACQQSMYHQYYEPNIQRPPTQQRCRYTIETGNKQRLYAPSHSSLADPYYHYTRGNGVGFDNYYCNHGNEQYLNPMILSRCCGNDGEWENNFEKFSVDFFRPEYMHDPPQAAEYFLQDIRQRMQQIRWKNKAKKYTPNLPEICEERESELESVNAETANRDDHNFYSNPSTPSTLRSMHGSTKETHESPVIPVFAGDSSDSSDSYKRSTDSGFETDIKEKNIILESWNNFDGVVTR